MSGSKKHKTGDRGSTEEDPNICKRANMAATEDTMNQEPTTEDITISSCRNHRHRDEPRRAERNVS